MPPDALSAAIPHECCERAQQLGSSRARSRNFFVINHNFKIIGIKKKRQETEEGRDRLLVIRFFQQ